MTTPIILPGDILEVLEAFPANHFHAVLCDPPYGLGFMGRGWDAQVPPPAHWEAIGRVCAPGAHLLAFGGTRQWHHLALSLERAGWEIRDTLMWLYGQGFPKNHNLCNALSREGREDLAEEYAGHGTALKPAWEPVVLARKGLDGTIATTLATHGTASLSIDSARIQGEVIKSSYTVSFGDTGPAYGGGSGEYTQWENTKGRWPANLLLDAYTAQLLGERSRYFYCAKASKGEKEAGLEAFEPATVSDGRATPADNAYQRGRTERRNTHPTVKPLDLCRYLASLLLPPPGGPARPRRVLVPYCGSGSEAIGAALAGWDEVIGIELDTEHVRLARARAAHWTKDQNHDH